MVYPGGVSSLRFEKMREGIVDFEKLRWLFQNSARTMDPETRRLAAELKQHLKIFTTEKEFNSGKLENDIKKGRELMDNLSDRLTTR